LYYFNGIRYTTRRKEAHNVCRAKKWKYVNNMIEETKSDHRTHRSRRLYRKVNRIRKEYKGQEKFVKNKNGKLITTNLEIKERWAKYFEQLINEEDLEETLSFA